MLPSVPLSMQPSGDHTIAGTAENVRGPRRRDAARLALPAPAAPASTEATGA
jgi:hypothetical protein